MKLALTILLFTMAAQAQQKFDVCTITTSTWDSAKHQGTSNTLLTKFRVPVATEITNEAFRHEESGLIVNAGIEYLDFSDGPKPGQPQRIRIALSVSDREQSALDETDGVEAGTLYQKNWSGLYVRKEVVSGPLRYAFILTCTPQQVKKK
jgi:hypothetical protein